MDSSHPQIPALLKNTHLFRKLSEQALLDLADQFEVSTVSAGETIFEQGDKRADSFYMVMYGSVRIIRQKGNKTSELANLVRGDYFGEEALITHRPRSVTVVASSDVTLLRLTYVQFNALVQKTPHLRENFKVAISSRQLSRSSPLDWLNQGEVIYVMARKHAIFLWLNLLGPVFALLAAIISFFVLYEMLLPGMATGAIIGGLAVLGSVAWLVWNAIDWGNDYYIVTNLRVVWLEVVLGLYDSRTEAPLSTVLSIGLNTDQLGRLAGYGDVLVHTFTGPILLHHVAYPEQVASMIEEYWQRSKVTVREEEAQAMESAIRKRLTPPVVEPPRPKPPVRKPSFFSRFYTSLFSDFIKVRIDEGSVVTYRKHWYVLVRNIWEQLALLALVIVFLSFRLSGLITIPSQGASIAIAVLLFIIDAGWWLYVYEDWRNDIYRVTAEQIIDIEKKPFSTEQKKAAPLESILSIEYERLGFLGVLLNFGTVKINVGGTIFDFSYVYNPSRVQQEIFRRIEERKVKKKLVESESERERLSDWIVAYHRSLGQGAVNLQPPIETNPVPDQISDEDQSDGNEGYY